MMAALGVALRSVCCGKPSCHPSGGNVGQVGHVAVVCEGATVIAERSTTDIAIPGARPVFVPPPEVIDWFRD